MLRQSVESLLDVIGTIDAALSKYSTTLFIQSNIDEMISKSSCDDGANEFGRYRQ